MKSTILFLLTSIFITMVYADMHSSAEKAKLSFDEHYVMLYYKDIEVPAGFYRDVLGLKVALDDEWVKLFQVTPGSFIGVVKEGENAYHKAKEDNAVMVSIVTDDVDAWYETVKASGKVTILKEVADSTRVPIRAFLVADPGGYTVEFFQWLR